MSELDRDVVRQVLEDLISLMDYDTYKYLKYGEEDEDRDQFPQMSVDFITAYRQYMLEK